MQERISRLEIRDDKLRERVFVIEQSLGEQNERFENLSKGYLLLGLFDNKMDEQFDLLTREMFQKEKQKLEQQYSISLTGILRKKHDKYSVHDANEKYISDLLYLMTIRWNTIIEYKNLWKKERMEHRESFIGFYEDLLKLEKQDENLEQLVWFEKTTLVFEKQSSLILEQERLISLEEELQSELETSFKDRENLYIKAVQLFSD